MKEGISMLRIRIAFSVIVMLAANSHAVTSKLTRHSSAGDFQDGQTNNVIISSRGRISLGRQADVIADDFNDVWSINCVLAQADAVYLGTSPNGGIYRYRMGSLEKIYPLESESSPNPSAAPDPNADADANASEPDDGKPIEKAEPLTNEHIFAMAGDVSGRLLAAISGKGCRLMRLEKGTWHTLFEPEPNDIKYIFEIAVAPDGTIYLGTGPNGKLFQLDSMGRNAKEIYDSEDKNILSVICGEDGFVYAGSDTRGLVYKIDPKTQSVSVLYDSDQPEITALLQGPDGSIYAAATAAKVVQAQQTFARMIPPPGRPEPKPDDAPGDEDQNKEDDEDDQGDEDDEADSGDNGGVSMKIPNTSDNGSNDNDKSKAPKRRKLKKPGSASFIYRIDPQGFVTQVFSEQTILFALTRYQNEILVGSGNEGQFWRVDDQAEENAVIFQDDNVSQITAIAASGDTVYVGTANPAKLIEIQKAYAAQGAYESPLVDAGQPAQWGTLHLDADMPNGTSVSVASRSGNVEDMNDPTFSAWTEPKKIVKPIQLECPMGRFCQYQLTLHTDDQNRTPVIREVAVASMVPNLAPDVESVSIEPISAPGKQGVFKIGYKAIDKNEDKLIYTLDFRKVGWTTWIEIKDDIEASDFEWDSKTVEDGRYEIRVTANDKRSNTAATAMIGSRISDVVIVDNTAPAIENAALSTEDGVVTMTFNAVDHYSAIGQVEYTIDSNDKWIGVIPNDKIFDTMTESFTIITESLSAGEHIIAIKLTDAVGNTAYKSFIAAVEGSG